MNFYNDKINTYSTTIRAIPANAQNTRIVNLEIPKNKADMGYNYVEVLPLAGDEPYYFIYMSISGEDFDYQIDLQAVADQHAQTCRNTLGCAREHTVYR